MKQLGKLIGCWGLVALLSACRECPEDEIIGDAYLTTATKELITPTDDETLTYRNVAGNQMHLESLGRNLNDDTLRFVLVASTCDSWLGSSAIGFYAPNIRETYKNDSINITLEANVRAIEQPNPYDTVLIDVLSVEIDNRNTEGEVNYLNIPVSLRNNDLEIQDLDTLFWITSYRLVPDTTLLGVPLTSAYYVRDEFNGGEVFITAEQGLAAFQIDSVLWVQD